MVDPVLSAPLKLTRSTSNASGSSCHLEAPTSVMVGASAHVAVTIDPGPLPYAQSILPQNSPAPSRNNPSLVVPVPALFSLSAPHPSQTARPGSAWNACAASTPSAAAHGTISCAR